VISRPYQQRRAYAICKLLWREATVVCASQPLLLRDYVATIGDVKLVIDMIVGDTERVIEYPNRDHAADQEVPAVGRAPPLARLIDAGFTSRRLGGGE